jgi:hypothetical protein
LQKGRWDERSALPAGLLVDAAWQIEQGHMHDAVERCAQAGVARGVIAHLLTEVDALGCSMAVRASRPVPGQLRGGPNMLGQPPSVRTSRWTSRGSTRLRARTGPSRHLCAPERQRVTPNSTGEPSAIEPPPPGTDAVSVPGAERYTLWTVMSAPATPATLRMWPAFEVTTAFFRRTAPSTTETSTMSS